MAHMLSTENRVVVLMERGEPGVNTSHKRKDLYASHAVELYATDSVAVHDNLVVANPFADANRRQADALRNLYDQLFGFSKLVIKREGNYNLPKIVYTGKRTGNDGKSGPFLLFTLGHITNLKL